MSYLRKIKWELEPLNYPVVKRNCPKCNKKTHYVNTENFRVNANKGSIDIWLIYQCENCKSTWNLSILERKKIKDIKEDEYQKFLKNDKDLAKWYGFDINIHYKNKAEIVFDYVEYKVQVIEEEKLEGSSDEICIVIACKYPIYSRVDKILSENLNISRNQVKKMYEEGFIRGSEETNFLKSKVKDGMEIILRR